MLEEPKRNLRTRKNPKYLNSDVFFDLFSNKIQTSLFSLT